MGWDRAQKDIKVAAVSQRVERRSCNLIGRRRGLPISEMGSGAPDLCRLQHFSLNLKADVERTFDYRRFVPKTVIAAIRRTVIMEFRGSVKPHCGLMFAA
jgi:hypothetical protein